MDIDELLNRYFEGETSSEEERELRAFFTSGNVPDRLAVYTPMFTYLEEESRKERQPDEALIPIDEDILFMLDAEKVEEKKTFTLRSVLYLVSGIAASFLLLLGLNHLLNPVDPCFCSDNYVVINGRCIRIFIKFAPWRWKLCRRWPHLRTSTFRKRIVMRPTV